MNTKKTIAIPVVAVMALALFAGAAEAQLDFGTISTPGDGDIVPVLTNVGTSAICYADTDNSGAYTPGDAVYINLGAGNAACGAIGSNWLRLTAAGSFAAGTKTGTGDTDHGTTTAIVAGGGVALMSFYDANGNTVFDEGDTAYWDIGGCSNAVQPCVPSANINQGDVRMTGFGSHAPGTVVNAGDNDFNLNLVLWNGAGDTPSEALHFLNVDNVGGFGSRDIMYALGTNSALPGTIVPRVNEVRLGEWTSSLGFGQRITGNDSDVVATLAQAASGLTAGNIRICAVSEDGSGTYKNGDPIFLIVHVAACNAGANTATGTNALRLSGDMFGTKVRSGDSDRNLGPLVALPTAGVIFSWYDADGNGAFNEGDTLYLDTNGNGAVSIGDVRLTPHGNNAAGTHVNSGDADINLNLQTTAAVDTPAEAIFGFDTNSDGAFNGDDVAYWASSAAPTNVLQNFVRLGAIGNNEAGSITQSGESDVFTGLIRINGGTVHFCAVDSNGNGRYDAGEPIIVDARSATCVGTGTARSNTGDVILSGANAGSILTPGDANHNQAIVQLRNTGAANGCLNFFDADANGAFNEGDTVYLVTNSAAVVASCNNRVGVGDLRLTPYGNHAAGTFVSSGDQDLNLVLFTAAGAAGTWAPASVVQFYDENGNAGARPDGNDVVYFALHSGAANSHVQINNLRIGAADVIAGPGTDPVDPVDPVDPTDPADPTDPTDPTDPVDPTPSDPVDPTPSDPVDPVDPADDDDADEDEATPGFGLVAILAAFGLVAVALRRRS